MTGLWFVSYVVLWILWLAVAVVLVSVLRNLAAVYSHVNSLAFASSGRVRNNGSVSSNLRVGDTLPEALWLTANGQSTSSSSFAGSRVAFAVVSATCQACAHALSVASNEGADPDDPDLRNLVVVSLSDQEETARLLDRAGMALNTVVVFDRHAEVRQKWGIEITPVIVVVDEDLRLVRQVLGTHPRSGKQQAAVGGNGAGVVPPAGRRPVELSARQR